MTWFNFVFLIDFNSFKSIFIFFQYFATHCMASLKIMLLKSLHYIASPVKVFSSPIEAHVILMISLISHSTDSLVCFFSREVLRLQLFKEEALDANDLLQSLNESIGAVSNPFNYDSLQTSLDQLHHQPYTEEMYVFFITFYSCM